MVKVGKKEIKVSVVRKILSSFNKAVKEDAIKGIWGMKTPDLQAEMEKFKLDKDGNVKHRFKAKDWRYDFKKGDESSGRVGKGGVSGKKTAAKKPPKKKKQKAQTAQDEEDESEGMEGQTKGTTSKTAPKNFEKKKNPYREWVSKQLKSGKKMSELKGKWKLTKEYKALQKKKKKK